MPAILSVSLFGSRFETCCRASLDTLVRQARYVFRSACQFFISTKASCFAAAASAGDFCRISAALARAGAIGALPQDSASATECNAESANITRLARSSMQVSQNQTTLVSPYLPPRDKGWKVAGW